MHYPRSSTRLGEGSELRLCPAVHTVPLPDDATLDARCSRSAARSRLCPRPSFSTFLSSRLSSLSRSSPGYSPFSISVSWAASVFVLIVVRFLLLVRAPLQSRHFLISFIDFVLTFSWFFVNLIFVHHTILGVGDFGTVFLPVKMRASTSNSWI